MGKLPVFVIPIVVVVLLGGLSFGAHKMLIVPKKETLAAKQKELADLEAKAARLQTVRDELARVEQEWMQAQADLQRIMETRSIPLSYSMPIEAMLTIAYELRHDLGPVITKWVESTGCTIESDVALPAPPGTPQPPPPSGFLPIVENLTLTIRGSLQQIEALYKALGECPRILTVGGLTLKPEGDTMIATVPFKVYLLVEAPPSAAAAAPAAGAGGMMGPEGGMMGGPGMGPSGPPGPGGPPPGGPESGPAGGGGEDEGGGEE